LVGVTRIELVLFVYQTNFLKTFGRHAHIFTIAPAAGLEPAT
jgi:hypothetical protein